MVYYFTHLHRGTGIKLLKSQHAAVATDSILVRLNRWTIETGLFTTVVAILDMILYSLFPEGNVHLVPCYVLTKAYSNCLLAVSWFVLEFITEF
jgi:hypothetical protein